MQWSFLIPYIHHVIEIGPTTADFFLFATFCALDVCLCYANIGNLAFNLTWNTPVSIIHGVHSKVFLLPFKQIFEVK